MKDEVLIEWEQMKAKMEEEIKNIHDRPDEYADYLDGTYQNNMF